MVIGKDIYEVLSALVPLYVAMILAYGSVRWWKILTPEQCSGINRFVAVFAVPFLNFHFISSNNIYAMNLRFIAADSLQKLVILPALFLWQHLRKHGDLGWTITLFSLSTLPNTLVLGIPLLRAMYGEFSQSLMVQIVVMQAAVWYTLLLFLFEYRAAKEMASELVPPELAPDTTSFRVESDVTSLGGSERLQAEMEVGQDGKLQMVVKTSTSHGHESLSARGLELHSLQCAPPAEPTPGALEVKKIDFHSVSSDKLVSPRTGGYDNGYDGSRSTELMNGGVCSNIVNFHALPCGSMKEGDFKAMDSCNSPSRQKITALGGSHACSEAANSIRNEGGIGEIHMKDGNNSSSCKTPMARSNPVAQKSRADIETGELGDGNRHSIPSGVMTRLILIMVWRKLVRNPNTYASIIGLVWSLVSFRYIKVANKSYRYIRMLINLHDFLLGA